MTFQIKAIAPTAYQASSLSRFNLNESKPGNGSIVGTMEFDSMEKAQQYLAKRAEMFFEHEEDFYAAMKDIANGALTLDAVTAYIDEAKEYVVEWESGRGTRYADGSETGASLISNAIKFNSEEEAEQYLIDAECGDHCFVSEVNE